MKTKYPLKRYEKMYNSSDSAHNMNHIQSVRDFAVKLAKIYTPEQIEIVYISATLHDIGLTVTTRETHEIEGYNLVKKDHLLKETYGEEDFNLILEGIREHRASNGKPRSILAKIISDADRISDNTYEVMQRMYAYHLEKDPEMTLQEILEEMGNHLSRKYDIGGTGRRVYFKESEDRLEEIYRPIIDAYKKKDFKKLEEMLQEKA